MATEQLESARATPRSEQFDRSQYHDRLGTGRMRKRVPIHRYCRSVHDLSKQQILHNNSDNFTEQLVRLYGNQVTVTENQLVSMT